MQDVFGTKYAVLGEVFQNGKFKIYYIIIRAKFTGDFIFIQSYSLFYSLVSGKMLMEALVYFIIAIFIGISQVLLCNT